MNRNETRIRKLEGALQPQAGLVCLLHLPGECRELCIRRHGYDPDNYRMTYLVMDELDARA